MTQYLNQFNFSLENMKHQIVFKYLGFGLSRKYLSNVMSEILLVARRMDSKDDFLMIQTYLVEAKDPFLYG